MNFLNSNLETQRNTLNSKSDNTIMQILIHIVCKQEGNKDVLVEFLPYIEGILIDKPSMVENIISISKKTGFNLMKCLLRIVDASEVIYDSFVMDISVRILSRVFSLYIPN